MILDNINKKNLFLINFKWSSNGAQNGLPKK